MATPTARFVIDKNNGRGGISLPLADGKQRPKDFVFKDGVEGKLISEIFNKDGDNAKVFAPDGVSEVEDARVPECLVDGRYLEVANVTYLLQSDQDKTGPLYGDACFPALGERIIGASAPSIPPESEHSAAAITPKSFIDEFDCDEPLIENLQHDSTIWHHKRKDGLMWQHEPDIQNFVSYVVDDVIAIYNLKLLLAKEVSVNEVRPDFWLLKYQGIPIGAIEVKIPRKDDDDEATLNHPNVAGQGLDYLRELQNTTGLYGDVFVIITTYKAWRVFWLRGKNRVHDDAADDDAVDDDAADDDAVDEGDAGDDDTDDPSAPESNIYKYLIQSIWAKCTSIPVIEEEVPSQAIPPTPTKRMIFADEQIYHIVEDAAELRAMIAKTLQLMIQNSKFKIQVTLYNTMIVAANPNSWSWLDPLPETFDINSTSFPNRNTQQLLLLADLGAGLHGRVWIASSTGGSLCVLKFFKEAGAEVKEFSFWQLLYPNSKARIQQFMGKPALIMPPFPPLPTTTQSEDVKAAVTSAVDIMLNKNVHHGDIRWENFGFGKNKTGRLVALPFDFGKSIIFPKLEKDKYKKIAYIELAKMFE